MCWEELANSEGEVDDNPRTGVTDGAGPQIREEGLNPAHPTGPPTSLAEEEGNLPFESEAIWIITCSDKRKGKDSVS